MGAARLSIVVPSYNQGRFIDATLRSLVGQEGLGPGELEILIVDGGSHDETLDVIRRYAHAIHYWVSEPDRGQTHALIKGFQAASGDLFGWLCSDDLIEPRTAREVIDYFDAHTDAEFIYGDACWIDQDGRFLRWKRETPFSWYIWKYDYNYIPQPATFWRRGLYERVGGLDERFALAMDGDLWARFATETQPHHVRRAWARMRFYPEQKNQRLRARSNAEDVVIRERLGVPCGNRPWMLVNYAAAKSLRIGWKLVTGCYG